MKIKVAALQCELGGSRNENVDRITHLAEKAVEQGAQLILPPELFEGPYFCTTQNDENFALARPACGHPTLEHFQSFCRSNGVAMPVSFFEKDGPHFYNSVAMIDADGSMMGLYRKSHIPDGPGYQEKFYFRPGNTGFKVWSTRFGKVGVGICWDQWFPEAARAMALQGADILLYPTAIGSEPEDKNLNTKDPWQRVMMGHAVANMIPVVAANRIGVENGQTFYGHSFICDEFGEKIAEVGNTKECALMQEIDLERARLNRASFGFFRDRRTELYQSLLD